MYQKPNVDPFHHAELIKNAEFFEYGSVVNPLAAGFITEVPFVLFPHDLHEKGPTSIIPLDISNKLKVPYPATSPAILANFIRILPHEKIKTAPNATSEVFYVIRGNGHTEVGNTSIPWNTGDFFTLPAGSVAVHYADSDSAFYWIHDEPLLNYLGVKATEPKFEPTLYIMETSYAALQTVVEGSVKSNRLSVLLSNKAFPQTRTITHTLWSMLGVLPINQIQYPHRHQSVAVDYVVECQPGCYTLIGKQLGDNGEIIDPIRADWKPSSVFVTPPGYWHSHHNESGVQAHVLPMQDAALHTYLRSLAIEFSGPDTTSYISLK